MTPEEELALVDSLLAQAASNGGVAEWGEGPHRVKNYSLRELLDWKRVAENKVYQSSHRITLPIRQVDI